MMKEYKIALIIMVIIIVLLISGIIKIQIRDNTNLLKNQTVKFTLISGEGEEIGTLKVDITDGENNETK